MMEKEQNYHRITQPFASVFDEHSRILILGSLPSVKSRENGFYYGNPQNRFWKVLAALLHEPEPEDIPEKRGMLLRHGIALWDVIESCDIIGSSDSSIKNVTPADLSKILETANIEKICANGGTAGRLYQKYDLPLTGMPAVVLPSTSPANAAWSLTRLTEAWRAAIFD